MKTNPGFFYVPLLFLSLFFFSGARAGEEITIIRNGGGAGLVENSLVGITLGVSQGADYLELPVNMSADDQLLVFKDTTLNRLTDVADLFPTKHRADGNYYVVDFSLAELRQLRLQNVSETDGNPLSLGIPTLQEGLTLIAKLKALLSKNTGVVIGLQDPAFYTSEGKDISSRLRQTLDLLSYGPEDKIFLQCADPDELLKISRWPQAVAGERFSLIQMLQIKDSASEEQMDKDIPLYHHEWLFTNSGLRILASYATAVTFPAEIIEKDKALVDKKINSLRLYGLKIFRQSPTNAWAIDRKQSFHEAVSPVAGSAVGESYFDGIYVDYLPEAAAPPVIDSAPVPAEDTETIAPPSTLPPFFSNLGLSQPKNTDNTSGDETGKQFTEIGVE